MRKNYQRKERKSNHKFEVVRGQELLVRVPLPIAEVWAEMQAQVEELTGQAGLQILRAFRGVYRVAQWLPAGSTFNVRLEGRGVPARHRWEFVGTISEKSIRRRYVNRYVGHLFSQGAQNPISYVKCD